MKRKLPPFDKYEYYLNSVQDPAFTADFLERAYRDVNKKEAVTLREDFCGTLALCCEWVGRGKNNHAVGVDLDPEPLRYGMKHYFSQLKPDEAKRVLALRRNVLSTGLPKVQVIAALNFSYYILKTRKEMLAYFKNCYRSLHKKGVLVLDCFGGSETLGPLEEVTRYDEYNYYWDQDSYDPVTHHAKFYIHFKRKGEAKRLKVFRYEWRMWTIAEITDLIAEAGFSKSHVYWEGTDRRGRGNGKYRKVKKEESCQAWVTYVVAER